MSFSPPIISTTLTEQLKYISAELLQGSNSMSVLKKQIERYLSTVHKKLTEKKFVKYSNKDRTIKEHPLETHHLVRTGILLTDSQVSSGHHIFRQLTRIVTESLGEKTRSQNCEIFVFNLPAVYTQNFTNFNYSWIGPFISQINEFYLVERGLYLSTTNHYSDDKLDAADFKIYSCDDLKSAEVESIFEQIEQKKDLGNISGTEFYCFYSYSLKKEEVLSIQKSLQAHARIVSIAKQGVGRRKKSSYVERMLSELDDEDKESKKKRKTKKKKKKKKVEKVASSPVDESDLDDIDEPKKREKKRKRKKPRRRRRKKKKTGKTSQLRTGGDTDEDSEFIVFSEDDNDDDEEEEEEYMVEESGSKGVEVHPTCSEDDERSSLKSGKKMEIAQGMVVSKCGKLILSDAGTGRCRICLGVFVNGCCGKTVYDSESIVLIDVCKKCAVKERCSDPKCTYSEDERNLDLDSFDYCVGCRFYCHENCLQGLLNEFPLLCSLCDQKNKNKNKRQKK